MVRGVEAGPRSGSNRVNRGGSWNNNARNGRSANRNRNDPGNRRNNLGFRLASTVGGTVPSATPVSRMTGPKQQAGRGW